VVLWKHGKRLGIKLLRVLNHNTLIIISLLQGLESMNASLALFTENKENWKNIYKLATKGIKLS